MSITKTLKTSLDTLTRVLHVVHWRTISKGRPEAWLYFYEGFLSVYDNALRRRTGSYYTPPEIVTAMVRLVDEFLRDDRRFGVAEGLASQDVTLADPAMGTGTFLLGVLQRIAERVDTDQGEGAVPAAIRAALARIIGFEIQFGPFAVAQLRLAAEVVDLLKADTADPEHVALRLFLTDTLGNPNEEHEYIPHVLSPLAASRRSANQIKRAEPITVVIGNPPYRERARGRGGWVESGTERAGTATRLDAAGRLGRQRAHEAPAQPVRLLLALGYLESLWRQRHYTELDAGNATAGRGVLHHRGGFPERTRI